MVRTGVWLAVALFWCLTTFVHGAAWNRYNIRTEKTETLEGKTIVHLKDDKGRAFTVQYVTEPGEAQIKKIVETRDLFFNWQDLAVSSMRITCTPNQIQFNIIPSRFTYKGVDYVQYMPAGMVFFYGKHLQYEFRMVKDNVSMKFKGRFINKPEFLLALKYAVDNPLAYASRTNYMARIDKLEQRLDSVTLRYYRLKQELDALRHGVIALHNTGCFKGPTAVAQSKVDRVLAVRQRHPKMKPNKIRELLEKQGVKVSDHEVHLILSVFLNDYKK